MSDLELRSYAARLYAEDLAGAVKRGEPFPKFDHWYQANLEALKIYYHQEVEDKK